jgi:hypothetical protein
MGRKRFLGLMTLAAVMICQATTPVRAHHSVSAEFEMNRRLTIKGVLTRSALINPHTRLFFDVTKPDGTVEKWEIAGGPAGVIRSSGMARMFKVGETYTILLVPSKDGSPYGRMITITDSAGKSITLFHEDPNNPEYIPPDIPKN